MRMNPYLGHPLYLSKADGACIYDLQGKRYLDFNMSNGAAMLGHNHPAVRAAVEQGVNAGLLTAAETPYHEALASRLVDIIPAAERVRFATVGTEVTVLALRIARHVTGRQKYLKFDGHFHGLAEQWLYRRDPETGQVVPSSGGVPDNGADDVVMVPWNDADAFQAAMREHGASLAAVICEPIHLNAGYIPPVPGFLEMLRSGTTNQGVVLVFDEVLSGFRTALGGVQAETGVTPDLTTHAKALANGLPLSSLSGRKDLMESLVPTGPVAHSGTYSGQLLSVLASLATLDELGKPGLYDDLNARADRFYRELQAIFRRHGLPVVVQGRGGRFGMYFGRHEPVTTVSDLADHDHALNARFNLACVERGLYVHPYTRAGAPGHAGISMAHTDEILDEALTIFDSAARATAGSS
jgi:glutamate-1-semialdehyde 2,1-aminomutase